MGVDIRGWIEVKPSYYDENHPDDRWVALVTNVGFLVGRNYDAFACFFGVRNHANFAPVAAERGIPRDADEAMQQEWIATKARCAGTADEPFAPSWITWAELKAIDWEEESAEADSQIHRYERDEQGRLVFAEKMGWDRRFAERAFAANVEESLSAAIMYPGLLAFPVGQEWEIDGAVYRSERLKRRDALSNEWRVLFTIMEALAASTAMMVYGWSPGSIGEQMHNSSRCTLHERIMRRSYAGQ